MHPLQEQLIKQARELADKIAAKSEKKQSLSPMLWKYTDPEGNEFWLKVKKMTVKSPFSGKNFTSKPVRETPSGVGTDLREEAKAGPGGSGPGGKVNNKRKKSASDDWKA
jgi:hypothetical protein